jgi:hypothetical protein
MRAATETRRMDALAALYSLLDLRFQLIEPNCLTCEQGGGSNSHRFIL